MTIQEIARIAGVSASTVSKIMNGKDASISSETRDKVLRTAKEYHYAPYSRALQGSAGKKFMIGFVSKGEKEDEIILRGINREAAAHGYSVVCSQHDGTLEGEQKAIARICSQNIDGVIWKRNTDESRWGRKYLDEWGIPYYYCDSFRQEEGQSQLGQDYQRLGYEAALYLAGRGHRKLGCLSDGKSKYEPAFVRGFFKCLHDHKLEVHEDLVRSWEQTFSIHDFLVYGITGIVCFDRYIADRMVKQALSSSYQVPSDVSVVALGEEEDAGSPDCGLTTLVVPDRELGEEVCVRLIGWIENHQAEREEFLPPFRIIEGGSAAPVSGHKARKIIVMGSINMDAVVNVKHFPQAGQTIIADQFSLLPGGKGANQSVGAARLGAVSYLIGMVGQDYEAKKIKDALRQEGVFLEGVSETAMAATGKAYITVQYNGESNVILYSGANALLTVKDILRNSKLFDGAAFCLLHTEMSAVSVECAARLAVDKGVRVILKPVVPGRISDVLLGRIYLFVPNKQELDELVTADMAMEEKAASLLDKGVSHVIVTLGSKGCYLVNREASLYFSAAEVETVDTTGASDAFLCALAVFLAEGFSMAGAIQYATYAAGLSVTRQGAQSALVDRQMLEMYADEIKHSIRISSSCPVHS